MNSVMSVMMLVHIIQAESRWFQATFQLDFVSLQYKLQLESIQQNQNVWTWNKPGITMEVTSQTNDIQSYPGDIFSYLVISCQIQGYEKDIPGSRDIPTYLKGQNLIHGNDGMGTMLSYPLDKPGISLDEGYLS